MKNKILNVSLVGKTNAGKSTFINSIVGEKISIENKKINTTLESVAGVINIKNTQIIFYDTPGLIYLKHNSIIQKKQKTDLWNVIYKSDLIMFIIDTVKFNYEDILKDIIKIKEVNKPIIFVFNIN